MPNPDMSGYVDLSLYDSDPQDLFDSALLQMSLSLPEWSPREGNTEVILVEGMAFELAQLVFAVNRLPSAIMQVLLQMFGIFRDVGEQPSAMLVFEVNDTLGAIIPSGTQALMNLQDGVDPVVFTTVADLVIDPGDSTGSIQAVGDQFTQNANGMPDGTILLLMDSIPSVNSVTLDGTITDGRDAELDIDWITRGSNRFAQLSDGLILPRQFVSHVLENDLVSRALALDNYDPGSGNDPGDDAGHMTLALYGNNVDVDSDTKALILADLQNRAQSTLAIHLIDPTINTINVTSNVIVEDNWDPDLVVNNVKAAINAYLSTANWDWSGTVFRNALLKVIGSADGVSYVNTMTTPAADVTLTDVAPLAVAGTLTITAS